MEKDTMEKGDKKYNYYWHKVKVLLKRFWHFFWEEDTLLSWLLNIVVAFLLIKGVIYPGLGFILDTEYPVVAVISSSMEHNSNFDRWWSEKHSWYENYGITKENFKNFYFKNGFNKGDIMVVYGRGTINIGDVVVFWGGKNRPIIHRVIRVYEEDGKIYYHTKGDNNIDSLQVYVNEFGTRVSKDSAGAVKIIDETKIGKEDIVGKAVFRIPYLGYIKIGFVRMLEMLHIIKPTV
ncbi:MAG: signal peptidase I [Candidatus Woesearchaeota archaeon]|nr:signal peptidase I [Candidatus Woesearchaeota archaeon]